MTAALTTQFGAQTACARTPVRIGVGVIVLDEGRRVLLEQRSDCGFWGLPGGRVEPGESIAQTAVREVLEETGLDVEIISLLGIYSDPSEGRLVTYPGESIPVHLVDALFEARITGGSLRRSAESDRLEFFSLAELPQNLVPPAIAALEDFAQGRSGMIR